MSRRITQEEKEDFERRKSAFKLREWMQAKHKEEAAKRRKEEAK